MANAYVMRTNMSVAIVAMVNHTAYAGDHMELDDECDEVVGQGLNSVRICAISKHLFERVSRLIFKC